MPESAMVTTASSIFAPEEMPSTNGPAIGLRKNVCKRKPERESAPPRTAAVKSRGNRIFHIIGYAESVESRIKIILKILSTESLTLPVLIFRISAAIKSAMRIRKTI